MYKTNVEQQFKRFEVYLHMLKIIVTLWINLKKELVYNKKQHDELNKKNKLFYCYVI